MDLEMAQTVTNMLYGAAILSLIIAFFASAAANPKPVGPTTDMRLVIAFWHVAVAMAAFAQIVDFYMSNNLYLMVFWAIIACVALALGLEKLLSKRSN